MSKTKRITMSSTNYVPDEPIDEPKQVSKCVWHLTRTGDMGVINGYAAVKESLPAKVAHFPRLRNLLRLWK